jgi:hypothetical protein
MKSKKPLDASAEEPLNNLSKQPPRQSVPKALISQSRRLMNLKKSLSGTAHQLLGLTPTSFRFFSLLPTELQIRVMTYAVFQNTAWIVAGRQTNGEPGLRGTIHPFMEVNHLFREEAERLRPRAFACVEKVPRSESDRARSVTICNDRKAKKPTSAPARINFNFEVDFLVISRCRLLNILSEFDVPDLKKLETIVITWTDRLIWGWEGSWFTLMSHLAKLPNIKEVYLIHQTLLYHGAEEINNGKKLSLTDSGPFHPSEGMAMRSLRKELGSYSLRNPQFVPPRFSSMRFTSKPDPKRWLPDRLNKLV